MGGPSWRRWLAVGLWIASIYAAIPFVRTLQLAFTSRFPREWVGYGVMAAAIVAALVAVAVLGRSRRLDPLSLVVVTACGLGFVAWTRVLWAEPVEAVHFVQYGVLGGLLVWGLRPRLPDAGVHLVAALAAAIVGTGDEILQWLTPRRFWDLRDVVINAGAAALVQPALWRIDPPRAPGFGNRSLRWSCRLGASLALLLALCGAATPSRLERLAQTVPAVAFTTHTDNPMVEYGHRHVVPGLGVFNSRFTLAELDRLDRERGAEVAAILDRYPIGRYQDFLREVRPGTDPFLYEARVHVFSRDANLADGRRLPEGSAERRRELTAAEREHRLLERFFSRSVGGSTLATPPEVAALLAAEADPQQAFVSRAGRHLITWATEGELRFALLGLAVLLLAADRRLGHRRTPS